MQRVVTAEQMTIPRARREGHHHHQDREHGRPAGSSAIPFYPAITDLDYSRFTCFTWDRGRTGILPVFSSRQAILPTAKFVGFWATSQ